MTNRHISNPNREHDGRTYHATTRHNRRLHETRALGVLVGAFAMLRVRVFSRHLSFLATRLRQVHAE